MTRTRILTLTAAAGSLIASVSAGAQNLKDRIDHVMQQRTAAEANNASKATLLGALLYTDVSVQFQDTHARDALNYLQTILGVNLVGRYSDDKTGIGIDPETPINLNITDKPAISVLEQILAQCEEDEPCTWQIRDGYIEVGTKERLSSKSAQEIRYYPVKDLLFEPPKFDNAPTLDLDSALNQGGGQGGGSGGGGGGGVGGGGGGSGGGGGGGGGTIFGEPGEEAERPTEAELAEQLVDLITETIEPEAWDLAGGEYATIRYYQGTLIVRAPDYIHRQVGGYPFAARPRGARSAMAGSRYVTFSGTLSDVKILDFDQRRFTGAAGGGANP